MATTEETDYPVTIYVYAELVKQEYSFASDGSEYIPQIILGAGSGSGQDYGKGFIYKAQDGLYIKYLHSQTGEELVIKLTDDGLDLSDFPTVTFKENVVYQGICQLWVQTDPPVGAKTNDVWVDTDDYTRYDKTTLTASTTLSESDSEVITASGTITITMHAATTAGIIKKSTT